jgi:uncharacterized membrane protein
MSHQSVEAARGHAWFRGAIDLIAHNPVPLLVIALLFVIGTSVVSLVPVLGTLAVIALTPVLGGGFMYALREEHEGRGAQIEHLFRGFQEPGRLLPLMLLGVPALVAGILVAIALIVFVGAAALQMIASGASSSVDPASFASLGIGVLVALMFGLLLVLAAAAIVVFAVPRVMLDGIEPFTAMKESLAASLSNVGALLLFTLMFVAALLVLLVATALVGWIPLLGQLVALLAWFAFGVGWIAVSNGGVFLAYRDLWPAPAATDIVLPYGPPPPAPPVG